MSGVVLRCPNCGTTRATPGECEACHEAQVRYHCTNHTPGRWLDNEKCQQCGARFGDPIRAPARPTPSAAARRKPSPAPVPPPPFATPASRDTRTSAGSDEGSMRRPDRSRKPSPEEAFGTREDRTETPFASWQELLWAIARSRRMRTELPPDSPDPIARTPSAGGCLMRVVLLIVIVFVALVIAPFLFGGFLFGLY